MILSLMLGGLTELIRQQGGIDFLVSTITSLVRKLALPLKTGNSLAIALPISVLNVCIANNTVAIMLAGSTAKELAEKGEILPKDSASLLDIFACVIQGILPYGGQLLLLGASFAISPKEIVPYSFFVWF
ncbi:MAG: Na+/H+ antiporter NhaC [Paraglaciecola sp.]|jgi:Na+/H+ antiporter NhaC